MVPSPRIEREPPALQAGVLADYTNSANVLVAARSPPFERCPHKSKNECRCGRLDGSWSELPRTCRVDCNDCLWPKMKNPSRSGPEGFVDLSIVARIFHPGGTPPHRLGCPILTSMTCPHDAPP